MNRARTTLPLRGLLDLLLGPRAAALELSRLGKASAKSRLDALEAVLQSPDVLAAFPETSGVLLALARGEAGLPFQESLPPLGPPPLSMHEALALMARAAEPPNAQDVIEALTRLGLRPDSARHANTLRT